MPFLLAHLQLLLRLRHELEFLPRLELELGDGGRAEEAEDDLEDGVLAHAQPAHPQVRQDRLRDRVRQESVKIMLGLVRG